jgi:heme-degrading monooxygenase HmoA
MRHQPGMISRHWKGLAKPGRADAYIAHLKTDTFAKLLQIPGFVSATILRRELDAGTEFQIVTVWESFEAIRAFSGPTPERAVVPPAAQSLLDAYDSTVAHYEVADTVAAASG